MLNIFDPQTLQKLAVQYGLRPSREYGQNYLLNKEVIERMVAVSGVGSEDTVVEVGPGFGVLTLALAAQAKTVMAYEIEKRLLPYWQKVHKTHANITVVWGNVLRLSADIGALGPFTLVANLPYQITSQVLRFFLEDVPQCRSVIVMVQKEVAQRLCAPKGDLSVLGIATQFYSNPEYVMDVNRNNFWPVPGVDSAVVKLERKAILPAVDVPLFFRLVRAGFSSRRKFLLKNLVNAHYGERQKIADIFERLGFLPTARAQELDVEDWLQLFLSLST